MMTSQEYLEALERDTAPGATPSGWYPVRSVEWDGVELVETLRAGQRLATGTYHGPACFALVQNIPLRGPAWMRLVFRGVAYEADSDEATAWIAAAKQEESHTRTSTKK